MATTPSPKDDYEDDYDDRPMWKRRPIIFFGILLSFVGAAAYVSTRPTPEKVKAPKVEREITISLPPMPPPPPPPPPPPKVEPPKEEEIVKQETPVETPDTPETPPDAAPPSINAPAAPGGILPGGTGRKGTGIGGGKKRGKFDGFVIATQKALVGALRQNAATKTASLRCDASLWSDSSGRITKAVIKNISGDSKVAQTIDSSILEGFQLPEAPPVGMPMPINMRISIDRPN